MELLQGDGKSKKKKMPVFVAFLKADLENVASLKPKTTGSVWVMDVKNGDSNEERKGVSIDAEEEVDLEGSRGVANLVIKFADAAEKANCSIITPETYASKYKGKKKFLAALPTSIEASGEWVPFLAFEARGMDITQVHLGGDNFVATATSGAVFEENLDLSEGDWSDYDEDNELPVSITNIQVKVQAIR